jgi:hypothetical protein
LNPHLSYNDWCIPNHLNPCLSFMQWLVYPQTLNPCLFFIQWLVYPQTLNPHLSFIQWLVYTQIHETMMIQPQTLYSCPSSSVTFLPCLSHR